MCFVCRLCSRSTSSTVSTSQSRLYSRSMLKVGSWWNWIRDLGYHWNSTLRWALSRVHSAQLFTCSVVPLSFVHCCMLPFTALWLNRKTHHGAMVHGRVWSCCWESEIAGIGCVVWCVWLWLVFALLTLLSMVRCHCCVLHVPMAWS